MNLSFSRQLQFVGSRPYTLLNSIAAKELRSQFLIAQRIAKFKLPERLEIVPEFPISAAGKIMRRTLREMIEAKLQNETPV